MHRIIVTLKLGSITPGDAVAIAALQDRVLSALGTSGVTVNRKYSHLPQMALSLSPEALSRLRAHPDVASVADDGLSSPTR